jgi:hypothetical protein
VSFVGNLAPFRQAREMMRLPVSKIRYASAKAAALAASNTSICGGE